ncbi:hypothetical protein SASPL_104280 [Salvia splendens]|uniref:Uncharacterized protein n=1 Tax=Salvia splendens TaxID=180675 RepID=A0A8X8YMI1_SALSN|nr:hypothetical protein SASPL_104280 [Salvia splendens]
MNTAVAYAFHDLPRKVLTLVRSFVAWIVLLCTTVSVPVRMLFMDSKSETEVEDVSGDDASNSDATGVSISSIALLGEKHGVEEDRAVSPADHQVSASKEIYWSCSSDVNNILSTAPLPAAALLSDVDGDFKCLLQGHTHDEWDICLKMKFDRAIDFALAVELAVGVRAERVLVAVHAAPVEYRAV